MCIRDSCICLAYEAVFLFCAKKISSLIEHSVHIRHMFLKCRKYSIDIPDEDPRIPVKVPTFDKYFCKVNIRLFSKSLDLKKVPESLCRLFPICLNIPVASFRPCLLYTSPSPRDRTRSRMPSS